MGILRPLANHSIMKMKLRKVMQHVEKKFHRLRSSMPFTFDCPPAYLPKKGIYLLYEGKRALYVGRSNNIRSRLRRHTGRSHYQATFAFLLAREAAGRVKPTYKKKGSREQLLLNRKFKCCFDLARERISKMNVLVIVE